ncbi:MAG TPA: ABC transporter permease, partial [Syntrophorhabdaceae bacterium]|nr:ABC transporter permease [Syntrophorhabdaceae bacterium]
FLSPMFLLSGIFFPLHNLPAFVGKVAWFTPLYHLTNVCRALAAGSPGDALEGALWIIVVVVLLSPFPFRLMRRRIIR